MERPLDVQHTWLAAVIILLVAVSGCIEAMGSPSDLEVIIDLDDTTFHEIGNVSGTVSVWNHGDRPIRAVKSTCSTFWLHPPDGGPELVLSCPIQRDSVGPPPKTLFEPGDHISEPFRLEFWPAIREDDLPPGTYGISAGLVWDAGRSNVATFELTW